MMKKLMLCCIAGLVAAAGAASSRKNECAVELLQGFPAGERGIEQGVSGCYAGAVGNLLVMAGGCNFPEVPAADGGAKRYYRGIYAATLTGGAQLQWHRIGTLPREAAYGVSISLPDGILCIGGSNAEGAFNTVFMIRLNEGKAETEPMPSLPAPMDNFTGCSNGRFVDIFADRRRYRLDLHRPESGWQLMGEDAVRRVQPISGYMKGCFCVWGGFTPKTAEAAASAPDNLFTAGGAATMLADGRVLAQGGVDHDIFLSALNSPTADYMRHAAEWYRFNPSLYIRSRKGWKPVAESPLLARAGAALVSAGGCVYVIGGELKPGVRTPTVCRITNIK